MPTPKAQRHWAQYPQLVVRWSSGSWDSSQLSRPSESGSYYAELKPAASELQRSLSNSETSDTLHPMDLPISVVNVRAAANRTHIGKDATSLWTTVTVSADVSPTPFPGTSSIAPLDIAILLDAL